MKLVVNDEPVEVGEKTTVEQLLANLGMPDKGIAVAVDWAVVPRSQWHLWRADGARVEVLTSVQGG